MIPNVSSEPPLKKARIIYQEPDGKRTGNFKDEGPSKKKRKTLPLSDEQIKRLSPREIDVYLKRDDVSDHEKMKILKTSTRVDYARSLFTCMIHCTTEIPALYCLKKGNCPNKHSTEGMKPLTLLRHQLRHHFKKTFDYNKLYLSLKKRGATAAIAETSILHEACRRGLKDLILSCLQAKQNLFRKNDWGESGISLMIQNFNSEDIKYILSEAVQAVIGRRSLRLAFENHPVNWLKELGDTWEARAALLFDLLDTADGEELIKHIPQALFEKIYLVLFKQLPKDDGIQIQFMNSLDRPKPDRNEILDIVKGWKKGTDPLMPLFEGLEVSSNIFLFWALFIAKEKINMSHLSKWDKRRLWHYAMNSLVISNDHFSKYDDREQLEFISWSLGMNGSLPDLTDVNTKLLNYIFEEMTFEHLHYAIDGFNWHTVYKRDNPDLKSEFWRNHPNDVLLFLSVKLTEDICFTDYDRYFHALTPKNLVRMISLCHSSPNWLDHFIGDNCSFNNLELKSGGHCENTWEELMKCVLYKLGPFSMKTKSPILQNLKKTLEDQKCQKEKCQITKALPGSWLDQLMDKGWTRIKRYGRTELYKNGLDGTYMAIKFLKAGEDPNDLYREYLITKCFHERGKELGLKSRFPKPEDFVEFYGDMPEGFFEDWESQLVFDKKPFHRHFAYIYSFSDDSYFRYLDEVESDAAFDKGREAVLHDLFLLINDNVIMTALAGLFHNQDQNRRYVPFPGLVFDDWRVGRTSGRIDKWEESTKWSNERESGLADTQEFEFGEDMANPDHPLTKQWFKDIFRDGDDRPKPEVILLANFLAEYLLVDELILGKRAKHQDRLDWKKTHDLSQKLLEGSLIALQASTFFSKRVCKRYLKKVGTRFDVYARQLAFWFQNSSKGYVPHIKEGEVPKELYPDGKVIVGSTGDMTNWDDELGFSEDRKNADLGSYNGVYPIKEGEMHRVYMVILILVFRKAKEFEEKACCDGLKSFLNGDYPKARVAFEEAISFNPYSKETWGLLAKVHRKQGNQALEERCKEQKAALVIQKAYDNYQASKED